LEDCDWVQQPRFNDEMIILLQGTIQEQQYAKALVATSETQGDPLYIAMGCNLEPESPSSRYATLENLLID
jgi:hypothetical protein